jgi:hypothetical protein
MELTQIYETTVAEPGSGIAFRYISIPARSFPDGAVPQAFDLAADLDLDILTDVSSASDVPVFLASLIRHEGDEEQVRLLGADEARGLPEWEMAETLAFAELVPFESSPLATESVVGALIKGGGITSGALVGLVSAGPTPLLLLTVPAGMILCGAAAGIAAALEQGLRARLLRRLGVEEGQGASAGAAR